MRGRVVAFTIVGTTFAAIPFTCIAFASLTLPTGFTALLNAATPLFTAALGVVVLRQVLSGRMIAGLAVGVVAVLVLVGWSHLEPTPATLIAVAAGLGAPASYAVAGTYVRARLSDVPGVELATGMLLMGALVTLPVAILTGAPGTPTMAGITSLVAVGVVSTALAWPVFYRVLARSTPTVASTVTFIVPVFAAAWGALVLGEAVGPGAGRRVRARARQPAAGPQPAAGDPVAGGPAARRGAASQRRRLTARRAQPVAGSLPVAPIGTATSESGSTSRAS